MATIGNFIGAIIGAVIGFYTPIGPVAGAQIGWALGGIVDPEKIEGPRLSDRKVQVSSYGVAIPILYGGDAGAGNVIWSIDLIEHEVENDNVTLRTYGATCAVLIGEGPIEGIRRIWADAKLVCDFSDGADSQTQISSLLFSQHVTFYPGTEDQMPDPTMEAVLGVGNVPAYRGYCYVVFNDIPVGDFGNRIPNFRFETSGASAPGSEAGEITYEPLTIRPWSGERPEHGTGGTQYTAAGETFTDFAAANAYNLTAPHDNPTGAYSDSFLGYSTSTNTRANAFSGGATLADDPQYVDYWMAATGRGGVTVIDFGGVSHSHPDSSFICGDMRIYGATVGDGVIYWTDDGSDYSNIKYIAKLGCGIAAGAYSANANNCTNYTFNSACAGAFPSAQGNLITHMRAERVPSPPDDIPGCVAGDPCLLGIAQLPGHPEFCINCDGVITPNYDITYEVITGTFRQLASVTYVDGVLYQNALGPVHSSDEPEYDDMGYWSTARNAAVLAGTMREDIGTYPVSVGSVAKGTAHPIDRIVAPEANTTLDVIVADVSRRAGMPLGTYNVTALEGIPVMGYSIARQMPAWQALVPLQQAFWWEFVESGREIKAVLRGGEVAVTIGFDDLGASESEDDDAAAVLPMRGQETELPATVNVSHPLRSKGYEIDTQRDRRITTGSQQVISMELAVVMTEQKAAEVASVTMYKAWTERTGRSWSTTRKYAKYEPTDIKTLNDGEFIYRVRVTDKSEEGQIIKWRGVDEAPAVYSPVITPAIGLGAGAIGAIPFDGPMKLELIDSPIVLDSNDDAGSYGAAAGYTSTFPGGSAFRSVDAGATYTNIKTMTARATLGYAVDVLGPWSGGNMVDESNAVTIRMHSGTLVSITQAQLLNNGNTAILGNELINFKRPELIAPNTYRITGFLRGRKTEQHMGTHAVGDRFVLFTPAIYRMPGTLADIGVPALWKGVTTGQTLDEASSQSFTNTGAGLKPLAPAHLYAIDIGGGQYTVRWVRRTRIGGKWRDGVDVPLGETSESYTVVISTGGTINSTTTTSASTLDVTAAPGDTVTVYQQSGSVGRGFPASITFT